MLPWRTGGCTYPLSIPTILCPQQEVAETERLDSGNLGVFCLKPKLFKNNSYVSSDAVAPWGVTPGRQGNSDGRPWIFFQVFQQTLWFSGI